MTPLRRSLARTITLEGIGLHSGSPVRVRLCPAPAGHGLRFRRTDLGSPAPEIPAHVEWTRELIHATCLGRQDAVASTVEHLLASLYALGVNDLDIELDGPEVPILDGSALPFVQAIQEAGLRELDQPLSPWRLAHPVEVREGDAYVRAHPGCDHLEIRYGIEFPGSGLASQDLEMRITPESFEREIAPARTFVLMEHLEKLRQLGLIRGGSEECAVVVGIDGPRRPLLFPDEFVRHKILDLIGDLALLGFPLRARIRAFKAGHALHVALVRSILRQSAPTDRKGHGDA